MYVGAAAALCGGFEEGHDVGLGVGEVKAVALAPELSGAHEAEEAGGGVGNEAEVIDKEEDGNLVEDVGVEAVWGQVEVWEVTLKVADQISDVKPPQDGGEATAFGEAFEEFNV